MTPWSARGLPGQAFSRGMLQFMRDLDTPEIHGHVPHFGYRVYTENAIETVGATTGLPSNGHRSKKKPTRRGGLDRARNVPEVGQDELLGQQQPGDAVQANAGT